METLFEKLPSISCSSLVFQKALFVSKDEQVHRCSGCDAPDIVYNQPKLNDSWKTNYSRSPRERTRLRLKRVFVGVTISFLSLLTVYGEFRFTRE